MTHPAEPTGTDPSAVPPSPPPNASALRPILDEAEEELAARLEEACEVEDVKAESTGELIKLEEALSQATKAAQQAVSLRRKLRQDGHEEGTDERAAPVAQVGAHEPFRPSEPPRVRADAPPSAPPRADEPPAKPRASTQAASGVREFTDRTGRAWRAWSVNAESIEGATHLSKRTEAFLGEYRAGWLAFEALDGSEKKRLMPFPKDWLSLPPEELEGLLDSAKSAPPRKQNVPPPDSAA